MDWDRSYPERHMRPAKLRAAADFVEKIPTGEFNIEHWWLPDGTAFDDDRNTRYRVSDGPCGCAAGHMAREGAFGLTLDDLKQGRQRTFVIIGDIFGVSYKEAEFMFDQYAYSLGRPVRPADVCRRIRFMADDLEAAPT